VSYIYSTLKIPCGFRGSRDRQGQISRPFLARKLSSIANRGLRSARAVRGSPAWGGPHARSGSGPSTRWPHTPSGSWPLRGTAGSVGMDAPRDNRRNINTSGAQWVEQPKA
jgi:hypothetical protein